MIGFEEIVRNHVSMLFLLRPFSWLLLKGIIYTELCIVYTVAELNFYVESYISSISNSQCLLNFWKKL